MVVKKKFKKKEDKKNKKKKKVRERADRIRGPSTKTVVRWAVVLRLEFLLQCVEGRGSGMFAVVHAMIPLERREKRRERDRREKKRQARENGRRGEDRRRMRQK